MAILQFRGKNIALFADGTVRSWMMATDGPQNFEIIGKDVIKFFGASNGSSFAFVTQDSIFYQNMNINAPKLVNICWEGDDVTKEIIDIAFNRNSLIIIKAKCIYKCLYDTNSFEIITINLPAPTNLITVDDFHCFFRTIDNKLYYIWLGKSDAVNLDPYRLWIDEVIALALAKVDANIKEVIENKVRSIVSIVYHKMYLHFKCKMIPSILHSR